MVIRNFEAVLAVTPWLCALIAVLFAVRRMCDGRVRARTFRAIWFVVAVRAALPVQFTLPQAPASFELPEWGTNRSRYSVRRPALSVRCCR